MSGKNQVTLTIAGDDKGAQDAMARTGAAAKTMGEKVEHAGSGFDAASEKFDATEKKAMGFRDTVTGVQDTVGGFSKVLKGDFSAEALTQAGAGIGDLASGFANFLIPALASGTTGVKALSIAFLTSPITWIVAGIALIVGAFILLWTKVEGFRDFWKGVWRGIQDIAGGVVDWFSKLPDRIGGFFNAIGDGIKGAFKGAFNFIADAWNNTAGKIQFDIPGWVPFIGGNHFGVPHIPRLHGGGTVPGGPGDETLAILQGGETVTRNGASSSPVNLQVGGAMGLDRIFLDWLTELMRTNNLRLVPA